MTVLNEITLCTWYNLIFDGTAHSCIYRYLSICNLIFLVGYIFICTSLHNVGGEVAYIASGGIDGEVKLWTINGENVGSWAHYQIITTIKAFKDDLGGECSFELVY